MSHPHYKQIVQQLEAAILAQVGEPASLKTVSECTAAMDAARDISRLAIGSPVKLRHRLISTGIKSAVDAVPHSLTPDEYREARLDAVDNVLQKLTRRQHQLEP